MLWDGIIPEFFHGERHGIPVLVLTRSEGLLQSAFCIVRCHYDRPRIYGPGSLPGPERRRVDQPQPHGGGRDRQGRPGHRPGVPRQVWGPPRRAGCPGRLHPGPRRGHHVCHPGALLPPGPPAPLYRGHSGSRHRPGGGGVWGPQPQGGGERAGHPPGPRGPGDRACTGGPVPGPQRGVLSLHPDGKALCGPEVRHDLGRKDGRLHRGLPMDHRGGSPPPRPHPAQPVPVHPSGGGHGARR